MEAISVAGWGWFLLAVFLASHVGLRLAGRMPWSEAAYAAGLPFYTGLAIGPFLLGLASIAALGLLPGASHAVHHAAIYLTLGAFGMVLLRSPLPWPPRSKQPMDMLERGIAWLLVLMLGALLFSVALFPLSQNDPLEYATVGREFYGLRTLFIYPLLAPEANGSGFFAPWTHPPLYVGMIYATNLMQGHADLPGLMRLLAPWAALAAVGLIMALGRLHSRRTGLFAAVLLLLPPILYLGVESSCIDILPVLGFMLMISATAGFVPSGVRRGLWFGLLLGLALWTHSQALLFFPLAITLLVLVDGIKEWKRTAASTVALVLVAVAFIAWPYANNLAAIGSLISDTPVVFAMSELDWSNYFSITRGISTVPSILQYGILKGWFAYDAYSLTFWIMTLGAVMYARRSGRGCWTKLREGGPTDIVPWLSTAIILVYLSGMVLSVLLGIDLMVRNDRYMLVIITPVALLGGWYLNALTSAAQGRWRLRWRNAVLVGLATMILLQLAVFVPYRMHITRLGVADIWAVPHDEKLVRRAAYIPVIYLRDHADPEALVLSMRPSDMYYAHRRMMSYLDPRLLPFYRVTDPAEGLAMLKALGIRYVHVPEYALPPFDHSTLQQIVADPTMARLLVQADGNQLYVLEPEGRLGTPIDLTQGYAWSQSDVWLLGGRKPFGRLELRVAPMPDPHALSVLSLPAGLFQRDISRVLIIGEKRGSMHVSPGECYAARVQMKGLGHVMLWLSFFDAQGNSVAESHGRARVRSLFSSAVLNDPAESVQMLKRFCVPPNAQDMAIAIEQYGNSQLQIEQAQLLPVRDTAR